MHEEENTSFSHVKKEQLFSSDLIITLFLFYLNAVKEKAIEYLKIRDGLTVKQNETL